MSAPFYQTSPRFRAGVLLLAYLCAIPAALPLAFSTLARIEGSHGVEVSLFGSEARVTLTHGGAQRHTLHRHCAFARLLVSFSQPRRDDAADHLVTFVGAANLLNEKRDAAPDRELSPEGSPPAFAVVGPVTFSRPCDLAAWRHRSPAENAPPAFLLGLKSTLLLV